MVVVTIVPLAHRHNKVFQRYHIRHNQVSIKQIESTTEWSVLVAMVMSQ